MKHEQQVELLKKLLSMIDANSTEDAGQVVKNPTDGYVCRERAGKEWQTMFQEHPQIIGISADLPEPGTFLTLRDFGIPILATRDRDGKFHAFINACRHRGAVVTDEERGTKSRFSCPFHAWTYDAQGRLLGIRQSKMFGEIDKSCHGLVELPCEEKYGLLVVHPQIDGEIDIDGLLGAELAEQLDSWGIADTTFLANQTLDKKMNWKLAIDTFGENYHFDSLHKGKLDNVFYGDATLYDGYGRNHRLTLASRYVDVMRELPEKDWNLGEAGIIAYYLFPNTQLVVFPGVVTLFRIYPDPDNIARSITRISHYAIDNIRKEKSGQGQKLDRENFYDAETDNIIELNLDTQMEIVSSTLEEEDYYMAEKTQQVVESQRVPYFIYGRNEPALQHFHENYREVLGMPPMEVLNTATPMAASEASAG